MISDVRRRKEEKRKVLEEQLKDIEEERGDININLTSIKHLELANVTQRINDLNQKLDCIRLSNLLYFIKSDLNSISILANCQSQEKIPTSNSIEKGTNPLNPLLEHYLRTLEKLRWAQRKV